LFLFDTVTVFPESGFEELQLIMEAFLVTTLRITFKEWLICWRNGDVILGSGRG
jgi:hypothetical protein